MQTQKEEIVVWPNSLSVCLLHSRNNTKFSSLRPPPVCGATLKRRRVGNRKGRKPPPPSTPPACARRPRGACHHRAAAAVVAAAAAMPPPHDGPPASPARRRYRPHRPPARARGAPAATAPPCRCHVLTAARVRASKSPHQRIPNGFQTDFKRTLNGLPLNGQTVTVTFPPGIRPPYTKKAALLDKEGGLYFPREIL